MVTHASACCGTVYKKTNICKILKFNKSYKTNVSFLVEGVNGGGGGLINFFVEKGRGLSEKEDYKY
jgi:hypothetical protein